MNVASLLKIIGSLLIVYGFVFLAPALFSYIDNDGFTAVFLAISGCCAAVGAALTLSQRQRAVELDHCTGLALVTIAWVISGVIGAAPFYFSGALPDPVDALFESLSGFTGTGASVIADVESLDRGLLLWRSLTQWLGGMGIIVFFVALLPALGFSGVQLFRAEVAGPQKDRLTPRVKETAQKLWLLYVVFTVILTLLLHNGGMSLFDASNHALATLATGGFSTKNSGLAFYQSSYIDITISLFMIIGAVNFSLHYRFFVLRDVTAFKDTELGWFLTIIAFATGALFLALWGGSYPQAEEALRHSFFTVASIISSTGFSNQDFAPWPPMTHVVVVLLMVMGGMSGSTAGGIKCIRLIAAFKQLSRQLKQVVHPKAVIPVKANQHIIPEAVVDAIWGLIFIYFLVFSMSTLVLTTEGLDLVTASTASFSALSNIGPALGELGPTETYASLSNVSKLTLCLCMLLGRLEFFTVMVLFTPTFWRR